MQIPRARGRPPRCSSCGGSTPPMGRSRSCTASTSPSHNGGVLALLGPNGAGKSTTLGVASGQMEPTKGCFHVLGPPRQRHAARHAGAGRAVHAARRARHLPQPDRDREPAADDLRRAVPLARGGAGLHAVPPTVGAAPPGRRHVVGRRAADVGDGAHAQRGAGRPPARRDLHGPGADDRRRALPPGGPDRRGRAWRSSSPSSSPPPRSGWPPTWPSWCRAGSWRRARPTTSPTIWPTPTSGVRPA